MKHISKEYNVSQEYNTGSPCKTKREKSGSHKNDPRTKVRRFVETNWKGSDEKLHYLFGATNEISQTLLRSGHEGIVCYHKINHARHLNRFLLTVNRSLIKDGIFIGCVETEKQLKKRISSEYPIIMQWVFLMVHTVVRLFKPGSSVSKRWYASAIREVNRVVPLDEVFVRLHSCGFAMIDFEHISGQTYFAVRKINGVAGEPVHHSKHDEPECEEIALQNEPRAATVCKRPPVGCRELTQMRSFQNN